MMSFFLAPLAKAGEAGRPTADKKLTARSARGQGVYQSGCRTSRHARGSLWLPPKIRVCFDKNRKFMKLFTAPLSRPESRN
jgi:hypothetical protein